MGNTIERQDDTGVAVLDPKLELSAKVPWPLNIKKEWLEKGILIVPLRLSSRMAGMNTVHILYDQIDEILPYEADIRCVEGFNGFYKTKAVAEGDTVHIQLKSLNPTRIYAYSSWRRSFDELVRFDLLSFDWDRYSLRDSVIVMLSKLKRPAHYGELHSRLSSYKIISSELLVETLYRYSPTVFQETGNGYWQFAGWND